MDNKQKISKSAKQCNYLQSKQISQQGKDLLITHFIPCNTNYTLFYTIIHYCSFTLLHMQAVYDMCMMVFLCKQLMNSIKFLNKL